MNDWTKIEFLLRTTWFFWNSPLQSVLFSQSIWIRTVQHYRQTPFSSVNSPLIFIWHVFYKWVKMIFEGFHLLDAFCTGICNLGTTHILGQKFFTVEVHLIVWKISNSISDLNSLHDHNKHQMWQIKMPPDSANCPLRGKIVFFSVENHCYGYQTFR